MERDKTPEKSHFFIPKSDSTFEKWTKINVQK